MSRTQSAVGAQYIGGRSLRIAAAFAITIGLGLFVWLSQSRAAPTTTTFTAAIDAYVRSDQPSRNFDTKNLNLDANPVVNSYLRFNLSGLSGRTIESATLRLYSNDASSTGYQVRQVANNTWGEKTITYQNAPATGALVASSGTLGTGYKNVDVTSLVTGDGPLSIALRTTTATTFALASSESANRQPQLIVVSSPPVDSQPPQTTINAAPNGIVSSRIAHFEFSSSESGSTFECALDGSGFGSCQSPRDYAGLADGDHTFSVRATDAAGNVDSTPATAAWTVDASRPETTIDSGPSGTVRQNSASFAFSSDVANPSFECSLDDAEFGTCTSPADFSNLSDGSHTFRVRAIDQAGHVDASPASRSWTVDTTAPDTSIQSGPEGTWRSGSASFGFGSSQQNAGFECQLDGGAFEPCDATPTLHVANGRHKLAIRATDAAGNTDQTPVERAWWADALLQNGNMETPTAGWVDQNIPFPGWRVTAGTVALVGGGNAGPNAARVTANSSSTVILGDNPRSINSTGPGLTYTATGSVRSNSPGKSVCLRIREWNGPTQVGAAQSCRTTTSSWSDFAPLSYTPTVPGSELEVYTYQSSATASGDTYDVDGMALSDGRPVDVPDVPAESGDPVLLAAGDVASCWSSGDESVSRLLDTQPGTIAVVGDTEQNHGRTDEFNGCYDPSWGRHNSRLMPAVGDHEYGTTGAAPYWNYFGVAAGETGKGWYSYDRGDWHIVVLNSNCSQVGGCAAGSEQYEWLQDDLEENADSCVGAYFHHPRFSAGGMHGDIPRTEPFWDLLYQYRAEFVLGGNDHNYQRFAPQTPTGELDRARGVRQFVVGTGGTQHYTLGPAKPNTEVQNDTAFGVLKLTLHDDSYDSQFLAQEGKSFTDSGSDQCTPLGDNQPPDTTLDSGPTGTVSATGATFEFSADEAGSTFECSLDGSAWEGCSSPKQYTNLSEAEHTFRARAIDPSGNPDPTPATRTWTIAAAPKPNLLANGSFEGSLSGWDAYRAGLSLVNGGPDGSQFARVALNAAGSSYSIFTSPRPIMSPAAGSRYTASGWVRSERPGKSVCLRFREWAGSTSIGAAQSCRTATGTWERFTGLPYTSAGGDSLELYAYQSTTPVAGDSFDVDGLTLTAVP